MNELVIMKNERAVTSTTNVAKNFKREHHNVMKSVEALKKDVVNFNEMFFETTEPDSYNRERKVYLMNRDGFTLLAMGFTGKRAMEFKLKYIEAFNDMEKKLSKPINNTKLLLETALKHEEKIEAIETDVSYLKNTMRIDSREESIIQNKAKVVVVEALGGKKSKAYETMNRKAFSRFWGEFKRYFEVPRYGDIPKKQFGEAIEWIEEWQPDTTTRMEIKAANTQLTIVDGGSL